MATQHPTILLVDDEEAIRLAIQRWLTRRGWSVVVCAGGQEALDKFNEPGAADRYDAILCDLRMPGISGMKLHDWLRDRIPVLHNRLVLATGDVASGEISRFLSSVSCPVLEKPFEFSLLESTLDSLLEQKPSRGD